MKKIFLIITVTLLSHLTYSQCWSKLSTGSVSNHSLGIKTDGALWAWGRNVNGQLGDGTNINNDTIIRIGTENNWAFVSGGHEFSVATKSDGTLWAWGENIKGQLGNGNYINSNTPSQIGTDNNWTSVISGDNHTLALKSDGTLWAWGTNQSGQLGDNTAVTKNIPVQIGTSTNWTSVDAGIGHSVGRKSDGTIWSWGSNQEGQLGDGTNVSKLSPTQIGTDTNWAFITSGGSHNIAIKTDGTLWSWGANFRGQLGDGTLIDKLIPTQIGFETDWLFVESGCYFTIATKTDGTLWSWGDNQYGQLGISSTAFNKKTPVQINTNNNWTAFTSNAYHNKAINNDGALISWGWNAFGQLGNSTLTNEPAPIYIPSPNCNPLIISQLAVTPMTLFPNPTSSVFEIISPNKLIEAELLDISGRTLLLQHNPSLKFNISYLPKGIYYLKVKTELGSQVKKIIKE
jgi:hypothetical protein